MKILTKNICRKKIDENSEILEKLHKIIKGNNVFTYTKFILLKKTMFYNIIYDL